MRRVLGILIMCFLLAMPMAGCGASGSEELSEEQTASQTEETADNETPEDTSSAGEDAKEITEMTLKINDTAVTVKWEDNGSVRALKELAADGPVTIEMSPYGGFEQVGPIGADLPSNDTNITTKAGDIMLYMGSQMVIFHGSNSWAYTRLGKITDKSASELKELLGGNGVTVTVSAE